jgi:hypothetical protein
MARVGFEKATSRVAQPRDRVWGVGKSNAISPSALSYYILPAIIPAGSKRFAVNKSNEMCDF